MDISERLGNAALNGALEAHNNKSPMSRLWRRYRKLCQAHPVLAQSLQSALIGMIGALLGSRRPASAMPGTVMTLSSRSTIRRVVDWTDVVSFTILGAVAGGPAGYYWTNWLDEHGPDESPSQTMLLDQIVAQPPRMVATLVLLDAIRAALLALPRAMASALRHTAPPLVVTSWRVWPLATYLMLRYLPRKGHYRFGMRLCSIAWAFHVAKQRTALREA